MTILLHFRDMLPSKHSIECENQHPLFHTPPTDLGAGSAVLNGLGNRGTQPVDITHQTLNFSPDVPVWVLQCPRGSRPRIVPPDIGSCLNTAREFNENSLVTYSPTRTLAQRFVQVDIFLTHDTSCQRHPVLGFSIHHGKKDSRD